MPTTTKPQLPGVDSYPSVTERPRVRPSGAQRLACALALFFSCAAGATLVAQTTDTPAAQSPALEASIRGEPSGETANLTFLNRPIAVLRARLLGRLPSERAASAVRGLGDLVAQGVTGPVDAEVFDEIALVRVSGQVVFTLTRPDIDELSGETLQRASDAAVVRLRRALAEAVEARTPKVLLQAAVFALTALVAGGLALWIAFRLQRWTTAKLSTVAHRKLAEAGLGDQETIRASRLLEFQRGLIALLAIGLEFLVVYGVLTFVLREFPYTRPWGESMRSFLIITVENLGLGILKAIPGLFTAALIIILTRFAIRMLNLWFQAVERGRITSRWIYPDTVRPTRRLMTALLWLFAVVVAYPFLPGSQTDAFKGVSVFLGLMVTLGSSGLVNQFVSGLMLIYSRALRVGDFVKVGDTEGTVMHMGVISIKIRTLWQEEVTIPNAVMVTQNVSDYTSRTGKDEGVLTRTSVTIGYDAPWRQVQALLLQAAQRTPGLRAQPKPEVIQESLDDFYVRYTLLLSLERQQTRPWTLHALHQNIQDLFNEYGVQIMSPNYMLDPAAPKVVAKKDWFAAPAPPEP